MRKMIAAVALAAGLGACAREPSFSAPAPAGALDCAIAEAEELGYERMSAEQPAGYVRVSQSIGPAVEPQGERGAMLGPERVRPVYEGEPLQNQLLLRHEGDRLRIQVLAVDEGGEEVGATQGAEAHAQMILSTCTT